MWLQEYLDAIASHPMIFVLGVGVAYMFFNLLLDDIGDCIALIRKKK